MRKITQKWAFLMMTLVCLLGMSQTVMAQNYAVVGEGTLTSSWSVPVATYYRNSYTQQLYLADELGISAGNIVSVAFQYNYSTATTREISIFMANTDAEDLSDGFVTDDLVEVFSATDVTFDNTGEDYWVTIELETPFAYDGSSNLVVAVYSNYSSTQTGYSGGYRFLQSSATNMARYWQNDTSSPDQFTITDGVATATAGSTTPSTVSYRPNIQIGYTTGGATVIPCDKPSGITASDVTAHQATLAWADGSGVYNVEYKKASDEDWTPFLSATTLLTADLMNLEANTDYQARVQSVCADNQDNPTSSWKTVAFKTMIGLPFEENFDALSAFPSTDWKRYSEKLIDDVLSGTTTLGSAVSSGWTFSSSTTGVFESKHMYVNIWSTYKYWVVSPVLPMEDNVQLTFDMVLSKSSSAYTAITPGTQDDDKFVVLISTDSMATWTILRQWDNAGSEYVYDNIALEGEEVAIDLSAYNGENIQLAFYGASTASGGDNYLHIDNILVDYIPSCFKPTDLAVVANSVTSTSVELEWTANTSEDAWILQYKKSSEKAWQELIVTENPYTLENLDPYTNYDVQVAALCDALAEDGTSKYSKAISFKTAAVAPFAESFNLTSLPDDWTRYKVLLDDVLAADTVPTTPVSAGWLASSTSNGVFPSYDGHLKLQVYGTDVQHWIVSPFIEMNDADMQLTFDLALTTNSGNLNAPEAGQQADDKFAVLITTDGGESWEEIYTRDNVTTNPTYDQIACSADGEIVTIDLTAYASEKIAFAFYGESTEAGGNNYLHIANIRIDTIPDCEKPTGVALVSKTDTSATFAWDEVEGATWSYALIADTLEISEADYVGSTTGFTVTIDTLQENTSYAFYLRQDCGGIYSEAIVRTVTTFPAPKQVPWTENFESFEASKLPDFWDNSASSSSTAAGTSSYNVWGVYSYSGNKMIRMYNFLVQEGTALINTPQIVLPTEPAYELTFDYSNRANCGDLIVKISADGGASWATLPGTYGTTASTDKDNPGDFTEALVNLADYAGSTIMLQFFAQANYGSGAIFVDNISIHEVPNCLKPQGLEAVAESATTNSVQLEWVPQGSEANWLIQYKKATAEEWIVFDGDVNAHPFTLTGLDASSTYDVRVAAWCDPTDSLSASEYSNVITVATACDVIATFPYSENFDGIEGVTSGHVLPVCWEYINTVTGSTSYDYYPTVYAGSSYANSGTNALKLLSYYSYEGEMYAILPEMEGLSALRMKFNARAYSTSTSYTYYDATFVVGILNSAADTANFVVIDTITPSSTTYAPFEVKFNTYEGTGKHIAIKMVSPDYYYYDYNGVYIDDIVIDSIPDCFEPASIQVVEVTTNSVKFNCVAAAEGDSLSYAVVLAGVEPTEFIGVTADTILVEGLNGSTEYKIYLRTECANSHSLALSKVFQTKQVAVDLGSSFFEDFEGPNTWYGFNTAANAWVRGEAAHNGEGTHALYVSNDGGVTNGYAKSGPGIIYGAKLLNIEGGSYVFQFDWRAKGEGTSTLYDYMRAALVPATAELVAGSTVPTGFGGTTLPEGCIAIDNSQALNQSDTWQTLTSDEVTVPAGTYYLAFGWKWDSSGGSDPAAAVDNIRITKVLCGKPGTPTIEKANITSTSAEIAWVCDAEQTAWDLAMDTIAGFDPDTAQLIAVSSNPYLAENLLPEHTYYVYVRANCGDNFSAWSARASFKTAKSCQKPDGVEVSSITDTSAVVTWNTYGQSDFHLVYYITTDETDTVAVTGGSYTITGLEENTTYKVRVAADCDLTAWTGAKSFKTLCAPAATVVENFDGITGATSSHVMPDCWSYLNEGTSTSYNYYPTVYSGASYANSGSNSLKFYSYTGYADQYAILPAVEGLNGLRMKFNARKNSTSYAANIVVGVMTDPADATTFVVIDTVKPAGTVYEPFMVSFGEYAGEGMYAAFKMPVPASSYAGFYIDDIEMEEIPSCLEPTGLTVSAITTNSATLDWVSTAAEWQILVNGDTIQTSEKPYALSELTTATTYEWMVRAICAVGDTSAWSNAMIFTTECELISLANADYVEGFEAYEGSTYNDANGVAPVCWEVGTSGTVAPHVIGSGQYYWTHEGTKALTFYGSGDCYAVLPKFAEPLNTAEISFWAAMESATTGTLYLGYTTEEDPNTVNMITSYDRTVAKEMAFYETSLDTLPATASQLVFWWASSSQWSCCIDDVTVSLIPACPKTTGLEATMVGDVLATFAWDAEEDVTWEYGLVLDTFTVTTFVPTDADFTGTTLVNEVTIDTLAPQTAYLFFIRKVCGNETSPVVFKSFSTIMTAAALPYDDDFENGNNWSLINGAMTNAWCVGAAATESGNALYISNDGGTTFEYTLSGVTIVYAAKVFNFDKSGSYTVSYDWRANGESNYDFLRVAIVPATVELTAGSTIPSGFSTTGLPAGWKAADGGSKLNLSNAWQSKSVVVADIVPGYYQLVFAWKNDVSGGAQSPAAVDNIHIQHLDYPTDIEGNAGIENTAVKFLHEGQVYILINGVVYNITGQKVEVK